MQQDAELHPIGFGEERAILGRGQGLAADVAQQNQHRSTSIHRSRM